MNFNNIESLINLFAIILSISAFIITIIGFFASLKFYRDGVELQRNVNQTLNKIEEQSTTIQYQIGSMFGKILNSFIEHRTKASDNLDQLNAQLEKTKNKLIKEIQDELNCETANQKQNIKSIINDEIKVVARQILETKTSIIDIHFETPSILDNITKPIVKKEIIWFINKKREWVPFSIIESHFSNLKTSELQNQLLLLKKYDLVDSKTLGNEINYKSKLIIN